MNRIVIYMALVLGLGFTSCSSDDNATNEEVLSGENTVTFTFDHQMFGESIEYGVDYKPNENEEVLNVDFLKYIVSNFQLTDVNGKVFTYPKDQGYFFVDSATDDYKVMLSGVPAGRYNQVKFGLGVDQEKYLRGKEDQQEFWDLCAEHDLIWGWITGYKFINYQGTYSSETNQGSFAFHIGSHGSKLDNYKEVNLQAENEIIVVNSDVASEVTIGVEVSKMVDSTHKILLTKNSTIMIDPVNAPKIMENAITMFSIDKVTPTRNL